MLDTATDTLESPAPPAIRRARRKRAISARWAAVAAVTVVLLVLPLYLEPQWLQLGGTIAALAIGAIGLNLLTGSTGQLSLANPFFMATGALGYAVLASPADPEGHLIGFGWPPLFAFIGAVVLAGLVGLAFSPISARLKGIYLGMASLGLVFVAQHVLNTAEALSGGFAGRPTPAFEIFGLVFDYSDAPLVIAGVPFQRYEMLWYLGLVLLAVAWFFAQNVLNGRPGRAMRLVAQSELAAGVVGVNVFAAKGKVFFLSSVYAGVAGVMYALTIASIAPQSFGLDLSLQFLAMIVIGGMGSVGGAVIGAAFVAALPLVLQLAASDLPIFSLEFTASHLANYIYGFAIILVLVFKPSGLAGLWASIRGLARRRSGTTPTPSE